MARVPKSIQYVLQRVGKDPSVLSRVDRQTEDLCLKAVRINGQALEFVREQTPGICRHAFFSKGDRDGVLRHVREQTDRLCALAVIASDSNAAYVRTRDTGLWSEIIDHNPRLIEFAPQTHDLIMLALRRDMSSLRFVRDVDVGLCLEAMSAGSPENRFDINCIAGITQEMCDAVVRACPKMVYEIPKRFITARMLAELVAEHPEMC